MKGLKSLPAMPQTQSTNIVKMTIEERITPELYNDSDIK